MTNFTDEIWIVPAPSPVEGAKSVLGGLTQPVKINVASLKNNVKGFLESFNQMLTDLPKLADPYRLDEIELKIEVNGEGNVQLVGGIKAGATGGITFRLKRQ